MVRAPCCEKMGLKKGPWTPEEDQVLIAYIQRFGHANWRALPKQAGLLRCGKSCRLRWTNYLRPDIKRGNFTREEEETIISLHQLLGNRWSAIAARLPGRTDNEIKNVWHTHLKKRLNNQSSAATSRAAAAERCQFDEQRRQTSPPQRLEFAAVSSPQSCSDASSSSAENSVSSGDNCSAAVKDEQQAEAGESVWSEAGSGQLQLSPSTMVDEIFSRDDPYSDDDMEFWFDLLVRTGESLELPEL